MGHEITYRRGKNNMKLVLVHLGMKPYILDLIEQKFKDNKFTKSQLLVELQRQWHWGGLKDLSFKSVSRHLDNLRSQNWLNSKKIAKGTTKDSRNYYLSKKARDYLKENGRFIYGPLEKEREPEKVYVEKEKIKEVTKINETKFIKEI